MRFKKPLVVGIAAFAILALGAGVAVAADVGAEALTAKSGTSVTRVTVRTENAPAIRVGAAWATLVSSSVYAPAGGFVVATFSAESACYNGVGYCSVRILIDGVEAEPVAGTDFAFDSTDANRETSQSWESHSMQRTRSITATGNHAVVVQTANVGAGVTARYDDYTTVAWAVTP